MTDNLSQFIRGAVADMGDFKFGSEPPSEPDVGEDGDAGSEAAPADDTAASAAAVWSALSPEDRAAIAAGDSELADRRLREALAGDVAADEMPATPRDLVAAIIADPSLIGADMTAAEWAAWASTTSAESWKAACEEVGWPVELRPSYGDLPDELRLGHHVDVLNDRLARVQDAIEARKLDPTKTIPYL
jgi:hypothetical protein